MHMLVLTMFYLSLLIITSMWIIFWICLNSNQIKPNLTFLTGLRANFNWQGLPFFFLKLVPLLPMDLTNSFSYSHNNYFPKILSTIYKEFLIRIRCFFWVFLVGVFLLFFFYLFFLFFFSFFVFFLIYTGCPVPGYNGADCNISCYDADCRKSHVETGTCRGCFGSSFLMK